MMKYRSASAKERHEYLAEHGAHGADGGGGGGGGGAEQTSEEPADAGEEEEEAVGTDPDPVEDDAEENAHPTEDAEELEQ